MYFRCNSPNIASITATAQPYPRHTPGHREILVPIPISRYIFNLAELLTVLGTSFRRLIDCAPPPHTNLRPLICLFKIGRLSLPPPYLQIANLSHPIESSAACTASESASHRAQPPCLQPAIRSTPRLHNARNHTVWLSVL